MSDDLAKRFRPNAWGGECPCAFMEEDENGDWVSLEDCKALEAERDALAEKLAMAVEALRGHQLWTHAENVDGEFVLWAETGEVLMRLLPTHRHQNLEPAAVEFVLGDLLDLLNVRATLTALEDKKDG